MRVAEQLARAVAADIRRGRFGAEDKLPPMREIARAYSVSLRTVQDAWDMLKDKGLIDTTPRGGGRVLAAAPGAARLIGMPYPLLKAAGVVAQVDGETFSHRLLARAREALREHGFEPVAQPYNADNPDSIARLVDSWAHDRRHLAGVIIQSAFCPSCHRFIEAAEGLDLPWVTLNAPRRDDTQNFVGASHFQIGERAGMLLARLGLTDIAFMTVGLYPEHLGLSQFSGLVRGFERAEMSWSGVRLIRTGDVGRREPDRLTVARERTLRHIEAHGLPEVFIASDTYVLGIMAALRELNIDVPGDVQVLGLTGLSLMAERVDPPVTTIDTPIDDIADNLVSMMHTMIRDHRQQMPGRYCRPGMTVRRSLLVPEQVERALRAEWAEEYAASTSAPRVRRANGR